MKMKKLKRGLSFTAIRTKSGKNFLEIKRDIDDQIIVLRNGEINELEIFIKGLKSNGK